MVGGLVGAEWHGGGPGLFEQGDEGGDQPRLAGAERPEPGPRRVDRDDGGVPVEDQQPGRQEGRRPHLAAEPGEPLGVRVGGLVVADTVLVERPHGDAALQRVLVERTGGVHAGLALCPARDRGEELLLEAARQHFELGLDRVHPDQALGGLRGGVGHQVRVGGDGLGHRGLAGGQLLLAAGEVVLLAADDGLQADRGADRAQRAGDLLGGAQQRQVGELVEGVADGGLGEAEPAAQVGDPAPGLDQQGRVDGFRRRVQSQHFEHDSPRSRRCVRPDGVKAVCVILTVRTRVCKEN